MRNKNKPSLSLKIGYFLPAVIAIYAVIAACIVVLLTINKENSSGDFLLRAIHFVLSLLYYLLINLQSVLLPIGIGATVIVVVMIILTVRYQYDNTFVNYFHSISQIHDLRKSNKIELPDDQSKKNQVVIDSFNNSLKELFIDIRKDNLTVWILIPDKLEAKQILNNEMNNIIQTIKQNNPDYAFSDIEPMGYYYCLQASKLTA